MNKPREFKLISGHHVDPDIVQGNLLIGETLLVVEKAAYDKAISALKEIKEMIPHDSSIIAHDALKELGEL